MRMVEHLDKMRDAGIDSIKIEGRAKTDYYVAVTANAYRGALDSLKNSDGVWSAPEWTVKELDKISHRTYSTGFYFGRPQNAQTYQNAGYIRDYAVAAVVSGYIDGCVTATVKNKFLKGQVLDCLETGNAPFEITADTLLDEKGNVLTMANKPMMTVKIPYDREIKVGSMLRMKV